jgi:ribonuclease J
MWPGYLTEPSGDRLQALLERFGVPLVIEHTSGHASLADLQRLAKALDPESIVPIHSFGGHRFSEFFDLVTPKADGQWWEA